MDALEKAQQKLAEAKGEAEQESAKAASGAKKSVTKRDAGTSDAGENSEESAAKVGGAVAGMGGASTKVQAAQQEVAAATARVMEIQSQMLEANKGTGGGSGSTSSVKPVAGVTWSPQGTTNYLNL